MKNLKQLKVELNSKIEEILAKLGMECEEYGDNIYCCCPIHDESNNPRAFSFSKNKGIWKCWTRDCQQQYNNDVFGLIQGVLSKQNGLDATFSDVLKWANQFNTNKVYTSTIKDVEDEFTKLVSSIKKCEINQPNSPEIVLDFDILKPSQYFISRGFKQETLMHFDIGDCNDKKSKLYERSIIPIHDDSGDKIIGCTARAIKEYKSPKFLLYPTGFDKRFYLYNLHRAKDSICKKSQLIIVEGQSDVWRLYEAGITNVVGIFGRSLSKEQEEILHRLPITNLVILLDNDQSGREAKVQLQRSLNRMYKLSFPKIPTKDVGEMSIEQIKNILLPQI